MDPKPNLNDDLSDIICNKDLVVENKISKIKLEKVGKENTFLRSELTIWKFIIKYKDFNLFP